jgi:hypothetical protein
MVAGIGQIGAGAYENFWETKINKGPKIIFTALLELVLLGLTGI